MSASLRTPGRPQGGTQPLLASGPTGVPVRAQPGLGSGAGRFGANNVKRLLFSGGAAFKRTPRPTC